MKWGGSFKEGTPAMKKERERERWERIKVMMKLTGTPGGRR